MNIKLSAVILTSLLFGCSDGPHPMQYAPGSKIFNCSGANVELLRAEESSGNKKEIEVSTFNYFYPLRLFAVYDGVLKGELFKSIKGRKGIDLNQFKREASRFVRNRKKAFTAIHFPWGKFETLDPRIFLEKGDYILTARKGCSNETGIVLDSQLAPKYVYTYGVSLIVLKRDDDGNVESSLDFASRSLQTDYLYFFIDRMVDDKYLFKLKQEDSSLEFTEFTQREKSPILKIYRDQTLEFRLRTTEYKIFELINSPYYFHVTNPEGYLFARPLHMPYLTDHRRGIVFSFLEEQIERENKEVDKSLLQFKILTIDNKYYLTKNFR